jgi:hypothetical protein
MGFNQSEVHGIMERQKKLDQKVDFRGLLCSQATGYEIQEQNAYII